MAFRHPEDNQSNQPEPGIQHTISPTNLAPPPPVDQAAVRWATVLGILAGDSYGGQNTEVPHDAPKPAPMPSNALDPAKYTMMPAIRPDNTATAAPDNGSTIYSGSFAHDLLSSLNLPVTFENVRAINAWQKAEGTKAAFNPLATTQKYGAYTNFNSVGVKNYVDYHTGVMATANVLMNGKYNDILAALSRGTDAMAVAHAIAASPWGTGHLVEKVLGG